MKIEPNELKRFAIRVRIARAWKGAATGLLVGAGLAAGLIIADYLRLIYLEVPMLYWTGAATTALGILWGLFAPVSALGLADSIDRRAKLENRLTTAAEKGEAHNAFEEALQEDAHQHLADLKPAKLYPIRLSRLHGGAFGACLLVACLFLLGNTPILLSADAKKKLAEADKKRAAIERVLKPLEDAEKRGELAEEEKKLVAELRKLEKDLKKQRVNEEEALQKANELSKKGEKLAEKRLEKASKEGQDAMAKLDQMIKEKLKEAGMSSEEAEAADPQMMQMSESQLQQMLEQTNSEIKSLQQQLEQAQEEGNSKKAAELEDLLEQKKKQKLKIELSAKAKKVFERLQNHPLMEEIQAVAKELAKKMKEAYEAKKAKEAKEGKGGEAEGEQGEGEGQDQQEGQNGEGVTQAELDEYKKKIEALAARLEDDEEMQKFLENVLQNLKNMSLGECMSCMPAPFGLPIPGVGQPPLGKGAGGPGTQYYYPDAGGIHTNDEEEAGAGKTNATGIRGRKREIPGEEAYVEVKGPATLNKRSQVPYQKVLPSYKNRAEEAIGKKEIPKEHQERVRKYFESLGG
jgi:chemotaxis protein histidine kinase CheA